MHLAKRADGTVVSGLVPPGTGPMALVALPEIAYPWRYLDGDPEGDRR
jgi:hypothetical protein